MNKRTFNRNANKGNIKSSAQETKSVFDDMELLEFDEEFLSRQRSEFSAQTMILRMSKTPDEIDLEEHEERKKKSKNTGMRNSDLVFDAFKTSRNQFDAYLQLNGVGEMANFFIKHTFPT